jgi:hypothetical protein
MVLEGCQTGGDFIALLEGNDDDNGIAHVLVSFGFPLDLFSFSGPAVFLIPRYRPTLAIPRSQYRKPLKPRRLCRRYERHCGGGKGVSPGMCFFPQ